MNPALAYLFAAFAVVWLALFAYLLYLSSRIGTLQQQVDLLLREQSDERQKREATATPQAPEQR